MSENTKKILKKTAGLLALFAYFVTLPVITTILVTWGAYSFTQDIFFNEPWMMPSLMCIGTFLAGVVMRQTMEFNRPHQDGLGLFFLGGAAFVIFAGLTWMDLMMDQPVYSRMLPRDLNFGILNLVYALPTIGILGMIFFEYFTVKKSR